MADDLDTEQLDEFGFPIPTEEELAAERAKTDQVLKLTGAASAMENQLPSTLPTEPLNLPVSSGRMYMGPAESFPSDFYSRPSGTSINLVAPPSQEAAGGAAGRVAYMGRTYGGGAPYDPAMERFQAQQAIQDAVAKGMPLTDATRLYGLGMFGGAAGGKRYNVHGVGLVDESGRVLAATPKMPSRPVNVAGVGLVDPDTGKVIVGAPETTTETEVIPATEGTPGVPAIPARSGIFGIGARAAVPAVPATPPQVERRITRKVRVSAPKGRLTKEQATAFLSQARGDKAEARRLAKAAGYEL